MRQKILRYGIAAGLIVGVPLLGMMVLAGPDPMIAGGMLLGYTIMLVALSLIFLAIKRQRDVDGGGVIRFWRAFGLGLGISAVAGLCYVVAWEFALAVTGVDFIAVYADAMISEQRVNGAAPAAIARLRADMEAFRASYANPLYRMPLTFAELMPVGLLVSLVSAALLRNPRFMPARRA